MNPAAPTILGLIAGAADTLPISVAAHLLVARKVLGESASARDHDLLVQLGTCIGVAIAFGPSLVRRAKEDAAQLRGLLVAIAIASLPTLLLAGVVGPVTIPLLYDPRSIALSLVLGGVACLALAPNGPLTPKTTTDDVFATTPRQALLVGLLHPLCFWPGTSHVLVAWAAARLAGLSARAAFELAWLMALGSIAPVCLFNAAHVFAREPHHGPSIAILVGAAIGAAITLALVRRFRGEKLVGAFGAYRIAFGILVLVVVPPFVAP